MSTSPKKISNSPSSYRQIRSMSLQSHSASPRTKITKQNENSSSTAQKSSLFSHRLSSTYSPSLERKVVQSSYHSLFQKAHDSQQISSNETKNNSKVSTENIVSNTSGESDGGRIGIDKSRASFASRPYSAIIQRKSSPLKLRDNKSSDSPTRTSLTSSPLKYSNAKHTSIQHLRMSSQNHAFHSSSFSNTKSPEKYLPSKNFKEKSSVKEIDEPSVSHLKDISTSKEIPSSDVSSTIDKAESKEMDSDSSADSLSKSTSSRKMEQQSAPSSGSSLPDDATSSTSTTQNEGPNHSSASSSSSDSKDRHLRLLMLLRHLSTLDSVEDKKQKEQLTSLATSLTTISRVEANLMTQVTSFVRLCEEYANEVANERAASSLSEEEARTKVKSQRMAVIKTMQEEILMLLSVIRSLESTVSSQASTLSQLQQEDEKLQRKLAKKQQQRKEYEELVQRSTSMISNFQRILQIESIPK
ncbi:uncharacterized protein MONOS_4186 [Monocercomonoides exilis]|uniref:uncharacterized protein n=1 Tax=Monocercomonoides exilis TaxID=2049356 RepID=UPI003559AE7A|nr:hypothetical protein MONOS_4186 [Monocercomonoides exilis]|eukprot:MONOS_4186.1-p1 / transcript=MONOS_4186.1 / gene=MONOS_4186 / organism=Monocercomonoides_exilis_PA203 / gene_product=unspecified product / transcript_product=unspecified product / location=Mono_scaffold00107:108571-110479(+) / protein_length=471 / sequence_SO=supercontig / SO=protein_coding / is_pseudo=false